MDKFLFLIAFQIAILVNFSLKEKGCVDSSSSSSSSQLWCLLIVLNKKKTFRKYLVNISQFSVLFFLQNNVSIPTHRTLEQRRKAAQLMLDSVAFECPVLVDNMDDTTNKAYAGMPIRLYIIKGRTVEYAGGAGPMFYRPDEVQEWLLNNRTTLLKNTRHRA